MISPNSRINVIEKFLAHFESVFSPAQMTAFRNFIYAMFIDYRRLSLSAVANQLNFCYQKLQYFFSDSQWSTQKVNDIRVSLIENQKTTASHSKGALSIDDTASPKPYAKNTEGAQVQHCAPLRKQENCNVAVASCFVSATKHFPVNVKSYIPEDQSEPNTFKSKIALAKDLALDAIKKRLPSLISSLIPSMPQKKLSNLLPLGGSFSPLKLNLTALFVLLILKPKPGNTLKPLNLSLSSKNSSRIN